MDMDINPRGQRGLAFKLADLLGRRIASGEYPTDHRINPDALCASMGLSRTSVREGLRILESKGMIFARPHIGTRVRPVRDWDLLDSDISRWAAGTEIGKELSIAAVELAGALDAQATPENPLYRRMRQLLGTYALNLPPSPPTGTVLDRPEVSA
jgi:DNA-binding FadR family transcriptional regulator